MTARLLGARFGLSSLTFVSLYESRYHSTHGPFRREVEKAFFEFKQCGDPHLGITLFKCCSCNVSLAVPFSCKTRICPSCIARKAETTAIHLLERLPDVSHRHIVFSLPKRMGLRQRLLEDRSLLRKVTRTVHQVIRHHMTNNIRAHPNRREELKKAKPGIIVALHTSGDDLGGYHPHLHLCISDGVFAQDGGFYPMLDWQVAELREALRRAILKAFVRWRKLSPEAADTLAGWDLGRCGFSLFVGPPVDDREHLGSLLRYLFRSPISFKRLEYQEKTGKVRLKLKRGGHREWDHALDFLADLSIHVPKARQQVVTYAGHYANSTGNLNRNVESTGESEPSEPTTASRRWIPWSRLIARCWNVDPELCPKCGQQMKKTRPILERLALERLLKSIGRFGYPSRPPPAPELASDYEAHKSGGQGTATVVQLHFDDQINQCPPVW